MLSRFRRISNEELPLPRRFAGAIRLRDSAREEIVSVPDDPWFKRSISNIAHRLEALRHDSPLRSSPSDALRDVAVTEAMLNSGQTDQQVSATSLYPALHGSPRRIATSGGVRTFIPKHKVECGSIADVSVAVGEAVSARLGVRGRDPRHCHGGGWRAPRRIFAGPSDEFHDVSLQHRLPRALTSSRRRHARRDPVAFRTQVR